LVKLSPFALINKRESRIVEEIKGYFKIIQRTVDSFVGMVKAIGEGNDTEAKRSFQAILDGEKEADAVHRAMSMEIAEGAFFGGIREDVLNLLETMDSIPDSAKDAARFLESEERLDDFALSLLRSDEIEGFISNLQLAVAALGELIAAFDLGKKEMLQRLPPVEDREEDADTFNDELLKRLFNSSSNPNPITVIQMRDFLSVADDIADYAEDSSDVILVLVAKGYD